MSAKPAPKLTSLQRAQAAEAELASRVLSRRSLLTFTKRNNPKYLAGWVHADMCRRLEKFSDDVIAMKSPRLLLMLPPRTGKSELASKNFPAWHLGRRPDHEFIACSYNLSLAMTFSRKVKMIIEDPSYQSVFTTRLDPNNQSTEEWGIAGNPGGFVAAGVGGGITGKGANILSIDDPLKSAEDADSADLREKLFEWYGSTAYTRLSPGGGVLVTQCMTGDTPVLMADGTNRRLDRVRAGDAVATYDRGRLTTTIVEKFRSYGDDKVLKITMTSGKIVRANERHPFLATIDGELEWVRTKNLSTAHKIATVQDSGVNGKARLASSMGATPRSSVAATAHRTTARKSGLMDIVRQASTRIRIAVRTSRLATASRLKISTVWSRLSGGSALFASNLLAATYPVTGRASSVSITATTPARFEGFSATTATSSLGTRALKPSLEQWFDTSDFTLDGIASIEPDGVEEVFDLQIARTANFLANGLVSHNTCWHDDDLAGRLQLMMREDPEADQFEIVKYPAIAEAHEFIDETTQQIIRVAADAANQAEAFERAADEGYDPDTLRFLRMKGDALHPARYDLKKLTQIKKTLPARFWSALYQQNPVPEDGQYFLADQFRRGVMPQKLKCNVAVAFDFAISTKTQNDFTVGSVGLQDSEDRLNVAEMIRFKSGDAFYIVEQMLNLCMRWYTPTMILGVEDGQIWKSIAAVFFKRMRARRMNIVVKALPPLTDKRARASVLQSKMQQGLVVFNRDGDWYDVARAELLRFDNGTHDDCVDSLGWMARVAMDRRPPREPGVKPLASWKDQLSSYGVGSVSHMAA